MVARSPSTRWGKVQKILVREVHHVFRCAKYIENMFFVCFKIILSNQREVQSDNNRKFTSYMVCISYKKYTIKWNRVKFKQTCPRSSTTSRSAKNSMSKNNTFKNRVKFKQTCPDVQLIHVVHFRSRWTQKSWSRHFLIYLKTTGISFV